MEKTYFTYLGTDQIVEEEESEFRPLSEEEFEKLTESISSAGILQPLIVSPSSNGKYTLHAGYNRLRAARQLNIKEVPCLVVEDKTRVVFARFDTDLYRRQLDKNAKQEYEKIRQEKIENSIKEIFIPEIVEMYKNGELSRKHLSILSALSKEEQKKFIEGKKEREREKEKETVTKEDVNDERIAEYERRIEELTSKIQELEANQVEIEKIKKEVQKRLQEREKEIEEDIREKYSAESEERIRELIEDERARVAEEYKAEIEDLSGKLREMSKAKEIAQRQVDVLKEEIEKMKEKEKDYKLRYEKVEHDLEIARKTLEAVMNIDTLNKKIQLIADDLTKLYQTLIMYGREEFSDSDIEKFREEFKRVEDIVSEIGTFFS